MSSLRTTVFQQRVYDAVRHIPRGRVATYAEVARAIGCCSPQAVGQALKRNPYAPEVPCHRVIAANLTLGGFAGQSSGKPIRRKRRLLRAEGVEFADGKLAEPARLFRF